MPKQTKDKRVIQGKQNRNDRIRKRFGSLWENGMRMEVIIETLILETGLSESTIYQIVKQIGNYKEKEPEVKNPEDKTFTKQKVQLELWKK